MQIGTGGMLFAVFSGSKWKINLLLYSSLGFPSFFLLLAPSVCYFLHLCVLSLSLAFSLSRHPVHCVWFGHSFPSQADKTTPDLSELQPQFAHTHTRTLSLLLITHRKWAPMQTRPAWPVEPRMGFQALKCSPVEEIERDLSLPPSFILLRFLSCFHSTRFLCPFLLTLFSPRCIWMHPFCCETLPFRPTNGQTQSFSSVEMMMNITSSVVWRFAEHLCLPKLILVFSHVVGTRQINVGLKHLLQDTMPNWNRVCGLTCVLYVFWKV